MNYKLLSAALLVGSFMFTSCSDIEEPSSIAQKQTISKETADKIKALGFNPDNAVKIAEGYLVEKDIVLTDTELAKSEIGRAHV